MSEQMDSDMGLDLRSDSAHKLPMLRAMGFGELLDTTFSLYRAHFLSFLGISSGYFIAMLIAISIVYLDDPVGRNAKIAIWVPTIGVFFGGIVFIISSLISASAQAYLVGTVRTGAALRQAIRHFLSCFISLLLFGLVAVLLAIVVSASFNILYDSVPIFDVLLILIFIWVPGCFVTYWCFFASTILVEGKLIRASLRRGRDLIRGGWWRVVSMVLAIFLFSFAISFILRATIGFLLVLTVLESEEFMEILLRGLLDVPVARSGLSFSNTLMYLICLGANTCAIPIWVIGSTLLYFNQRIQKEGFDIEVMAARQSEEEGVGAN